jgi:DNA-binding beta-propeller fold protein YncE
MQKRTLLVGLALTASIAALGFASAALDDRAEEEAASLVEAPMFEVDPFWPKPLPNHWILGATIGVDVDSRDHVWLVHRNTPDQFAGRTELGAAQDPPLSECCNPAPPVLEFDQDGNLVGAWGGPTDTGEYEWPTSNHGITVDHMDNVWLGGNVGSDSHIVKFTRDGRFLLQVGRAGARANPDGSGFTGNSTDTRNFGRVAKVFVDPLENEVYVADGYLNRRVAVIDANTGEMKRYWGAYGDPPQDVDPGRYTPGETPPQHFRTPVHCAELSNDRLLYVCDRPSNRISVFHPDGTFVREVIIAPQTLSQGSTWDIAFSPDEEQRYIYLADGQNMKVYVIERGSMEVLYSFGDGGRQPGLFFAVHSIAVDSQGNIYTTETYEGKRIQKFRFMGMGTVTADDMGAPWPASRRRGS